MLRCVAGSRGIRRRGRGVSETLLRYHAKTKVMQLLSYLFDRSVLSHRGYGWITVNMHTVNDASIHASVVRGPYSHSPSGSIPVWMPPDRWPLSTRSTCSPNSRALIYRRAGAELKPIRALYNYGRVYDMRPLARQNAGPWPESGARARSNTGPAVSL